MTTAPATRPRIAYVGPTPFPDGGAAARRMLGNALSLREAGFEVVFGAGQLPRAGSAAPEEYAGFAVHPVGERTAERFPTLLKHLLYFAMGKKTLRWLETLQPAPVAVILYSGYTPFFLRLLPWCARRGLPLVFDAVEWYDTAGMPGGVFSPYRWNIELAMRYYSPRAKHIIAISRFLEAYYHEKGCATVRIPPTLDTHAVTPNLEPTTAGPLVIGYTGTPGRKDLFNNMLEGILRLDPQGTRVQLRVAGVSAAQMTAFPAMQSRGLTAVPPCVRTGGKIPHAEALALVRDADFSVLLRPPARYAQAGFPTKVVESLALGTPVICNITSDLGEYIEDGAEGILCADYQPESLMAAMERALALPVAERRAMRVAARARAEAAFDYRQYVAPLTDFLARIGVPVP